MAVEATPVGSDLAALVLVSPNFRPPRGLAVWLNTPAVAAFATWWTGGRYGAPSPDPKVAHAWTKPFPTQAGMLALATSHLIYRGDLASATVPALFVYSPRDQIVSREAIEQVFQAWGGDKERFLVEGALEPNQHVIAGRLRSPETTDEVVAAIVDWLQRHGFRAPDPVPFHHGPDSRVSG